VWHDESHFNRYMIDNPPTKILTPSYCYGESMNIPFPKKLLALNKNHSEFRS
jgi:histo-blood group ABO system transferase